MTDIDIDVPDRKKALALFRHVPAANKKKAHNSGVYFHRVPVDPFTGRCTLDYKEAEKIGYFKIDILNLSIYSKIRNEAHLDELIATEPTWELLEEKEFCDLVFHMKGHHEVCKIMKPRSMIQLAAVMAMIRPSKRYLIGKSWDEVLQEVWAPPKDGGYAFKKSHSLSYSYVVRVHMNLIVEGLA